MKKWLVLYALTLLFTGCENETFHRGYVISQTQIEESHNSEAAEAD